MTLIGGIRQAARFWLVLLLFGGLAAGCAAVKEATKGEQQAIFQRVTDQEVAQLRSEFQTLEKGEVRRTFARFDFQQFDASVRRSFDKGQASAVTLSLFDDAQVTIRTTGLTKKDDVYVWSGKPKGRAYGRMSLTANEHTAFGVIQVDAMVYEVRPVRDNIVAITEIDQRKLPEEGPPLVPQKQPTDKPMLRQTPSRSDAERPILKVLIVLPRPAYNLFCGDFFPFDVLPLISASAEDNLSKVFNAVKPTGIAVDVVTRCATYSPVGGSLIEDLAWVRDDAGIAALRDTHLADLVSLWVPSGDYCGRGYINFPLEASAEAWAFTVVQTSCALGNYSFAHELGHNLGMRHDRASDGAAASSDCNYGHVFPIDLLFFESKARSVMAYGSACGECTRMGLYSMPETIDFGFLEIGPMGVTCTAPASDGIHRRANNRQQLIDAAPTAAAFR